MAFYDLHEHQKQIVRDFVKIHEDTGDTEFYFAPLMNNVTRIWFDPSRRPAAASEQDLRVLAAEGLIELTADPRGHGARGSIRRSAVEAVKNEFRKPVAATASGGVYQMFYAPVGAVHSGQGNIVISTQRVGVSADEMAAAILALRDLLPSLPPHAQAEAAEQLDDLEQEMRAQPAPKQSRVKAYLGALWARGREVAQFAAHLSQIAKAYGIDLPDFRSLQ